MDKIHINVIARYDNFLKTKTKKVEKIDDPGYTYPHLRWMLEEIRSGRVKEEKAHRWLGFVQGILIREGHFKINEERNFTRPYLSKAEAKKELVIHKVESGDTLYEIARKYYGDPEVWRIIAYSNDIPGPDYVIFPETLIIPNGTYNGKKCEPKID